MATKLDIYKTAHAAALKAIETCKSEHEADALALNAFTEAGHHADDWREYEVVFGQTVAKLAHMKETDTDGTHLAKQAKATSKGAAVALLLGIGLLAAMLSPVKADTTTFFGSLIQVSTATCNTPPVLISTIPMPAGIVTLSHGGLTQGTNTLAFNILFSTSTNPAAVAQAPVVFTFYFAATNAATTNISLLGTNLPIYMFGQVVTTSNIYVGGTLSR